MATVSQIVKASLGKILVQASGAPIEADEAQDFIFDMNVFMLALDADGVSLGYTEVDNLGDDVTIPTGALLGLIENMGVLSAPRYGGIVTQTLAQSANEGLKIMRKLGQIIPTSSYPGTLPRGSGNEWCGSRYSRFYPDLEAEILAETSGAIGLETGTEAAS